MNKKKNKKFAIILLTAFLFIIFLPDPTIYASISRPEQVRIGLFYKYGSIDTTIDDINMSAMGGIEAGINFNGKFTKVIETGGMINASIDIKSSSYHIRIGNSISDINLLGARLIELGAMGLNVFPVCDTTNNWQIYEGMYFSAADAERALNNNIIPKLGAGSYSVVNPSSSRIIIKYANGMPAIASESTTAFLMLRSAFSGDPKTISLNGKRYRGSIELRKTPDARITVINQLKMQEYLYGVVPLEIGTTNTPFEALKAQSVAARTFALSSRHTSQGFDLCNTDCCQVYGGYDVENPATNNAVDSTDGIVATYFGNLATLYYFSASGGRTENSENVWFSPVPYLRSVADPYEQVKNWSYTFTSTELTNNLIKIGKDIGTVTDVQVVSISEAGRVLELRFIGTKGTTSFTKSNTRNAFPEFLPSQMFTVGTQSSYSVMNANNMISNIQLQGAVVRTSGSSTMITGQTVQIADEFGNIKTVSISSNGTPGQFVINGAGRGHGVGMSQHGAMGMARAGYTYEQILKHYYSGIELVKANLY